MPSIVSRRAEREYLSGSQGAEVHIPLSEFIAKRRELDLGILKIARILAEESFGEAIRGVMFAHRKDAGRQLAERLKYLGGQKGVLVLGLPRGGVVTGLEIARDIDSL